MNRYLVRTQTTMKPYNSKKWWIDENFIRTKIIKADNLKELLEKYRLYCYECGIEVSENAMKTKSPMYEDREDGSIQVGYVITGSTYFENDSKQFIDLWVKFSIISDVNFDEE